MARITVTALEDVRSTGQGGQDLIYLDPEDVTISTEQTARPGWEAADDRGIDSLAASIKAEGQLQPAVVSEILVGDPEAEGTHIEYHLIAGHRRHAAIMQLNATGKKQYKLACVVVHNETDTSSFRKALMENLHREQTTPIQMALNIGRIRADNGWEGGAGTAKVAKFLCVSPAQVTQHEKLLTLDEGLQSKIHNGELTAQQGFILVGVDPDRREEVLLKAIQLTNGDGTEAIAEAGAGQGEVADGSEVSDYASGRTNGEQKSSNGSSNGSSKAKAKGKVTTEALMEAAREVSAKTIARSRKELVAWFDMFDSPSYHDNTRRFVREFVDNFATGEAKNDRKLKRLFDMMVVPISEDDLEVLPVTKGKGKGKS